jgi:hypothetical protein
MHSRSASDRFCNPQRPKPDRRSHQLPPLSSEPAVRNGKNGIDSLPDFSQPGKDGDLPAGVPDWREGLGGLMTRGLIYTAWSARDVLPCDQKYRINAAFKQKAIKPASLANYADVYGRVTRIAAGRASEMSCAHGEPLHARIYGHTWGDLPDLLFAAVVTELSCARGGRPPGESTPMPGALQVPGGTPPDEFSRIVSQHPDEFYNEYDVCDQPETTNEPISFSYGEHVESCSGIGFAPFVERAEKRARLYHNVLAANSPFSVLRREWWTVPETLVVVVVYFV